MKKILFSLLFLPLLFLGCFQKEENRENVAVSKKIKLTTLDKKTITAFIEGSKRVKNITFSPKKDKGTVVVFWSISCEGCIEEIPHLIALKEKYKQSLKIVALLVDNSRAEEAQQFVEKMGITYDVLFGKNNYQLVEAVGGVRAIPSVFFFNQNGVLEENFVGAISLEQMEEQIKKVIGKNDV